MFSYVSQTFDRAANYPFLLLQYFRSVYAELAAVRLIFRISEPEQVRGVFLYLDEINRVLESTSQPEASLISSHGLSPV
ncbi:protein of unknown function [Bradyrhizobium vignae]|uniref:Uncharacterized protein n=1 Tax=Bradyrhizobium vignae TaxID=1549949 RepID=A0A2U3Q9K0_9BRAD|nr:protein of unknown function [Bradyrhizobium vignae]